jgi:hypothetical protein
MYLLYYFLDPVKISTPNIVLLIYIGAYLVLMMNLSLPI